MRRWLGKRQGGSPRFVVQQRPPLTAIMHVPARVQCKRDGSADPTQRPRCRGRRIRRQEPCRAQPLTLHLAGGQLRVPQRAVLTSTFWQGATPWCVCGVCEGDGRGKTQPEAKLQHPQQEPSLTCTITPSLASTLCAPQARNPSLPAPPFLPCAVQARLAPIRQTGDTHPPSPPHAPAPQAALTPPSTSRQSGRGSGRRLDGLMRCGGRRACSRLSPAACRAPAHPPPPPHVSGKKGDPAAAALSMCLNAWLHKKVLPHHELCSCVAEAKAPPCLLGPLTGHSTPQRSRIPSRYPSADRARHVAREHAAERQGAQREWGNRGAAQHGGQQQQLRATTHGPATHPAACARTSCGPAKQQQSPGRALQEVGQRLRQYAASSAQQRGGPSGGSRPCIAATLQPETQQPAIQVQGAPRAAAHRGRVPWTGDHYADASAEIADIDGRLQSLQDFLRASKAGQAAAVPA